MDLDENELRTLQWALRLTYEWCDKNDRSSTADFRLQSLGRLREKVVMELNLCEKDPDS